MKCIYIFIFATILYHGTILLLQYKKDKVEIEIEKHTNVLTMYFTMCKQPNTTCDGITETQVNTGSSCCHWDYTQLGTLVTRTAVNVTTVERINQNSCH